MGSLGKVLVEDCFGMLQVYSDGSVCRASESDIDFGDDCCQNNLHNLHEEIEWEDCLFDEEHRLYLRVYKPKKNTRRKIPLLYYFHGGGFCLGSRTWPNCHNCCLHLAFQLQSIVVAPDYRLAPEHRLPAAIEDGLNAMKWLQSQSKSMHHQSGPAGNYSNDNDNNNNNNYYNYKTWRRLVDDDVVDFDQVFVVGDSSGGNIAHQLAVVLGTGSPQLHPVRVRGYVLLAPFFGGSARTNSEAGSEPFLNPDALDRFWRLSLPPGESRDHPLANPLGPSSQSLETVPLDPILVIAGANEIMKDRIKDYAERLRALGKDVTHVEFEGQYHGFLTQNPCSQISNQLFQLLKRFMLVSETSC